MRILVAEDHPVSRKLLILQLKKWGYEVVSCSDGVEAWEILKDDDPPRLVILDWMMPGMDGLRLCQEIRKVEERPYIYIMLLTARGSAEDTVSGLEAGADDYIVKPFDPQELKVRVRAGTRVVQLQEDLLEALKISEFRATHDPLTRIWNRGAIFEILRKELIRAKREHSRLSVAIADVDNFKRVNDEHGHLAGDAVLRDIAQRLVAAVRPYDSVGRYGGEEFLIVLPGCDREAAGHLAERLRGLFDQADSHTTEGIFHVTMSFGVSAFDPALDPNTDALIRASDEALYRAKKLGRNRVEIEGADSKQY